MAKHTFVTLVENAIPVAPFYVQNATPLDDAQKVLTIGVNVDAIATSEPGLAVSYDGVHFYPVGNFPDYGGVLTLELTSPYVRVYTPPAANGGPIHYTIQALISTVV